MRQVANVGDMRVCSHVPPEKEIADSAIQNIDKGISNADFVTKVLKMKMKLQIKVLPHKLVADTKFPTCFSQVL